MPSLILFILLTSLPLLEKEVRASNLNAQGPTPVTFPRSSQAPASLAAPHVIPANRPSSAPSGTPTATANATAPVKPTIDNTPEPQQDLSPAEKKYQKEKEEFLQKYKN